MLVCLVLNLLYTCTQSAVHNHVTISDQSDDNQERIVTAGGLPVLVPLLASNDTETVTAAVAALRNLSIHKGNEVGGMRVDRTFEGGGGGGGGWGRGEILGMRTSLISFPCPRALGLGHFLRRTPRVTAAFCIEPSLIPRLAFCTELDV